MVLQSQIDIESQSNSILMGDGFSFQFPDSLVSYRQVAHYNNKADQKGTAIFYFVGLKIFVKFYFRIINILRFLPFLKFSFQLDGLDLQWNFGSMSREVVIIIAVLDQSLSYSQHLNIIIQAAIILSSIIGLNQLISLIQRESAPLQIQTKRPVMHNNYPSSMNNPIVATQPNSGNRRVSYFYNPNFGRFTYSRDHPMKPERISMAHSLITTTGVYRKLNVYHARYACKQQMSRFHNEEYIQYLEQYVSKDIVAKFGSVGIGSTSQMYNGSIDRFQYPPEEQKKLEFLKKRQQFKVGQSTDCPAFNGLYDICQISTGASIDAATLLLNGETDIAINWSGGLHHAKKSQASGFCYVNDIVIAILQLLQVYPRVLYLDIDVHHGDGVQQAFYLSNRVMSVSFHQFGEDFFPGTGNINQVGQFEGKNYSLNIPLKPGISDQAFFDLFKDVMQGVMAKYRPHALVVQLGADSLCHDKLGQFNLSLRGHGNCLKYMLNYGLPTIMLGGGGYTIENVSRCWAYETAIAVGQQLEDKIPKNDYYYQRYNFEQKLHFPVSQVQNKNSQADLDQLRRQVYEHIRQIESAPGISFHSLPSNLSPWANWNEQYSDTTQEHDQMHQL